MNILNCGQNYYVKGGSDRYMIALQDLLEKKGHHVVPFAARHVSNLSTSYSNFFPERVNFERPLFKDICKYIYNNESRKSLSKLLDVQPIDLAHLQIYYGQLTTSILSILKRKNIPIVQTLHEYKLVCPTYQLICDGNICEACIDGQLWKATIKRCNRGSIARSLLSTIESYVSRWNGSIAKIDHFIAVSEFLRQKMIEFGVPAEKISTVHNFIDSSSVQPNYACGEYFLFFGRIEKIKGIETLLKAAEICRALPIYIVGEGSAREEMESITERMGLQHVRFLGFQNGQRLQELISGACATLVPSEWYETFGLTIVESFAHGKPVIASRIGGMTEVVSDGQDGFLMQPGNAEEMAERMKWLIDNPAGTVAMGRSGRQKVETEFGPEKHYHDLSQIYRQLVS